MLLTPKIIQPVETRCETYLGHLNGTTAHQDVAPSEKKNRLGLFFMNAEFLTQEKKSGAYSNLQNFATSLDPMYFNSKYISEY